MKEMIEIIEANGRNNRHGTFLLISNSLVTMALVSLFISIPLSMVLIFISIVPLLKSLVPVHRDSSKEKGAKAMTLINLGILLIEITLFAGFP